MTTTDTAKPKRTAVAHTWRGLALEVARPWRDVWIEFECWLLSNTVYRVPFVVVRRDTMDAREYNAFVLGQDSVRFTRPRPRP